MAGPKEKFSRLYDLGVERLAEVDDMLIKGRSPKEVAMHIQTTWGLYGDISTDSFAKQIQRYRTKELDPRLALAAERANKSEEGRKAVAQYRDAVNVQDELSELIRVHKARIYKMLDKEKNMPFLLKEIRYEMKELVTMFKVLADLQLETGVLTRAPRAVAGIFQMMDAGSDAQRAFEADVKNSQNLRNMVDDFFAILEGETPTSKTLN